MISNKKIISIAQNLLNAQICIIPTDTIYGIACLPIFKDCLNKVNEIKKRQNKNFLMISSGLDISKYIKISNFHKKYLDLYKGKTLISKPTDFSYQNFSHLIHNNTISIRDNNNVIINKLIKITKMPIVTTSVNVSGKNYANSINNIDPEIKNFFNKESILDIGDLQNQPSKIINIENDDIISIIRI